MKLISRAFPACCTAKIIAGFGETATASVNTSQETTEEELNTQLNSMEKYSKDCGDAVVIITLNSDQKTGDKVLRSRGYKHSKWMSKTQHPKQKLRVYYKALN